MDKTVAVVWKGRRSGGKVDVIGGRLKGLRIPSGKGTVSGCRFSFPGRGGCRLEIRVEDCRVDPGAGATRVCLTSKQGSFTFLLRDVCRARPILVRGYGAAVTDAKDSRSFEDMERDIRANAGLTALQRMEQEPEEDFATAAANVRAVHPPVWLGLGRDIRIFEAGWHGGGELWNWVRPKHHAGNAHVRDGVPVVFRYDFMLGRGIGCRRNVRQRLDEGVLPILHTRETDGDILYDCTAFVSLETSHLDARTVRGTHFLVADAHAWGHMFTAEQEKRARAIEPGELNLPEETVFHFRAVASNMSRIPRYAWFRGLSVKAEGAAPGDEWTAEYDGSEGRVVLRNGGVAGICLMNGNPMPEREMAVLLPPGEPAVFEFRIPHRPVPRARAEMLGRQDFQARLDEARAFWRKKLGSAAGVRLPEKRIQEMVHAGLLHLDLVTYGREPGGTLAPTIGRYAPIGSESSPIIQFFDSMGRHDIARRCLAYFLEKQHDDGFIQNFWGYMLETGAALWSMGEHFRYTRDTAWVKKISPKLLKSCDYLIAWRDRNRKPGTRGRGYGMIEGKVADPEDPFHSFMLNGYAYLGIARTAEMLEGVDPVRSAELRRQANEWKKDIRESFFRSLGDGPVVPLGDGTWCPTCAPWTESAGPLALYAEPGSWYTHGTFLGRDSMLGPLYLVFQEVLDVREPETDTLTAYHSELFHDRNVAFSQPYYSIHPWVHLRRGEVKPFLKAYYNAVAALADRETYTFFEHFFGASPHKTHEEAWFLMQTRWMLYLEDRDVLKLLPGVPRRWLEDGKCIRLENAASYFGPVSVRVDSAVGKDRMEAVVECNSPRRPGCVKLRLPHPDGRRAADVRGGRYDRERETVRIEPFCGRAHVVLTF